MYPQNKPTCTEEVKIGAKKPLTPDLKMGLRARKYYR